MKRLVLVCFAFICLLKNSNGQETWQIVIENDTLTEAGRDILEYNDYIYVASSSRCQPYAQSCVMVRKLSQSGNILWKIELPVITNSNENLIHEYEGNILVTGRKNYIEDPERYSFYKIDTEGNILDLTHMNLPYQSNFNYGSLVKGDTLYMYGASREDVTEEGINVDALIVTYDLVQDTFSYEYFDYGQEFVDIWDMRLVEDGSILFYSAHRRQGSVGDSLDYVVERLWPDGHRTTTYYQPHNSDGGVRFPQMEYLGDGLIVLLFPNEDPFLKGYSNFRIINLEGEVIAEKNYRYLTENSISYIGDIRKTNDGDILICGRYFDDMVDENDLSFTANAFVSKMTRDGTIEWLRHFRTEDDDGEPIWSGFLSVLSLTDNGIVAVGVISNSPSDLLIMKLDEDGCFGPDDCGGGVVTDVEEIEANDDQYSIKIYPNPVLSGQPLYIAMDNYPEINGGLYVQVVDLHGRQVIRQKIWKSNEEIDISSVPSGVYFLIIGDRAGTQFTTEKLIVI